MASQINSAAAGGLVVAAQHGNIDVHQWEPRYHLEAFAAEPVPPASPAAQPSRLLSASSRIVDFYGRHTELAGLRSWRDAADPAFSVQLW